MTTDRAALVARIEALKLLWQGMEQQALEAPANRSFAQLAHDTWVAFTDVLSLLTAEPERPEAHCCMSCGQRVIRVPDHHRGEVR
jgi:hypothetical protein